MASTYAQYNGDGTNRNFAVPFPYLSRDHVIVTINGTTTPAFTWLNDSLIQVTVAPAAGLLVDVRRKTPSGTPVDFEDGSVLAEADLDLIAVYTTYLAEEAVDSSDDSLRKNTVGQFDARGGRVTAVAAGVVGTDAVNKAQLEDVFASDVSALTVIKNAVNDSASAASTSAAASGVQAGLAGDRAAAAAGSVVAAQGKVDLAAGEVVKATEQAVKSASSAADARNMKEALAAVYGGSGYMPPVAYTAGLSMTVATQTVTYNGNTYAPLMGALPFVTSGSFETAKFRLIQGVSGADLAASDGAMLVGGTTPIYVIKDFRKGGGTDSEVINRALRKIESDALPGARLIFECGRTYNYDKPHSLGVINDLELDFNGALFFRAPSSATSALLTSAAAATGAAGLTLNLDSIPANWAVGENVAAIVGTTDLGMSDRPRITAIDRTLNRITLSSPLTSVYTGLTSFPAGTVIAKVYSCFVGRPSVADSTSLLPAGANRRISLRNGSFDGNVANQPSNSWRFSNEVVMHSEGGTILNCKFSKTAAECIVGHGMTVSLCTFLDLSGSALHTSVNDFLVGTSTPTIFVHNVLRRTNLKGQAASGHAEGAITFSWGPGHLIISSNLFDGGNEPMLGKFGTSSGANASRLLVVQGNIVKGYPAIFAGVQASTYGVTVTGNAFHDCGDNTSLTSTLARPANLIENNTISGNTVLPNQLNITRNRVGPMVIEVPGGTGPAITTMPGKVMAWYRPSRVGDVDPLNLYENTIVLESAEKNLVGFATPANNYGGIQHYKGAGPIPVAYWLHDNSKNQTIIGSNHELGSVLLKSGNYTDALLVNNVGHVTLHKKVLYLGDRDTDDSWLMSVEAGNLVFRRRVGGAWVIKNTISGA